MVMKAGISSTVFFSLFSFSTKEIGSSEKYLNLSAYWITTYHLGRKESVPYDPHFMSKPEKKNP